MSNVLQRFLKYVSVDTQSMEEQSCYPSTEKQLNFAKNILKQECIDVGLRDVEVDKYGYVTATLPSNVSKECPTIAFLAHMDTSPDCYGENIKPQIIENYDGSDIKLNDEVKLTVEEFPALKRYVGNTIVTASGNTLLGADDKAGIAEILEAMEYLINHPEIPHGTIKIAFTPDEEVGQGVDFFDVKKFGADFGYTLDGGEIGELEYETFNAAKATITVHGKSIHPGSAYKIMKNAGVIASNIVNKLPKDQAPSTTKGYEGYFHLSEIEGSIEIAKMNIYIRDFDRDKFQERKDFILKIVDEANKEYGLGTVKVEIKDEYFNMGEVIKENFQVFELAKKAMEDNGITPIIKPVRGGTDGSRLSFMGLPCPNIFTGGHNFHGPYEYISVESMDKAVEVIINICVLNAQ